MKQTILSVTFPDTDKIGRVLVVDGLIDRTSINMRKWSYGADEYTFRIWCNQHNLVIEETPCPDVETRVDYEGNEIENEEVING